MGSLGLRFGFRNVPVPDRVAAKLVVVFKSHTNPGWLKDGRDPRVQTRSYRPGVGE